MKQPILLFFAFFLAFSAKAQQPITLFNAPHLTDNSSVNPAYLGTSQWELVVLPLTSTIYSDGPTFNDFITKKDGRNVLTYPAAELSFDQNNLFQASTTVETFRLIYNHKDWSIALHHASIAEGRMNYSGALLAVAIQGNAPFIGQNIALDTDFSALSYEEVGISGALELGKLTIGGRLKLLAGHSTAKTRKGQLSLRTDDDIYQLSLDADLAIDVAGPTNGDLTTFNFGPLDLNFSNNSDVLIPSPNFLFNYNNNLFNFGSNSGMAFDFGATWRMSDQWGLSFSALNIGRINWTDNPRNYTANEVFEFDGINLGRLTFNDDEGFVFDNISDSLDILQFDKTTEAFVTNLPAQFFLGLDYEPNEKWRFGATAYHRQILNNSFSALALSGNFQIIKTVNIGLAYSLMNQNYSLLGGNVALNLGPIQLYALTDNLLGLFHLAGSRTLNARVGLRLALGPKI
ncbi:MAG: DUF5723 family protein [Bacteroidota bacterium]